MFIVTLIIFDFFSVLIIYDVDSVSTLLRSTVQVYIVTSMNKLDDSEGRFSTRLTIEWPFSVKIFWIQS